MQRSRLTLNNLAVLTLLCVAAGVTQTHAAPPSFTQVRGEWQSSEGVLFDREGRVLHELRVDPAGRRLAWVALADVSPAARALIVRAEDQRFRDHAGVDWWALSGAAVKSALGGARRGASTISMQVAAQLDRKLKPARAARTLTQKWEQVHAAIELEKSWSKDEILEAYFNLSTFRGELQGIGAAARALFGKQPSGLDEAESLLLAALLRGPNTEATNVATRACALARATNSRVPCDTLTVSARASLGAKALTPIASLAPHVARELLSGNQANVKVTLDADLQSMALQALQEQLALLASQNVHDGAVLVADNASGEILAYVGNGGERSSAWYVDGVLAPRQAGSTLKPFLYQLAIESKLLTAASLMDDAPVNLMTPGGLYVPQNYDREFHGLASVRVALASSLNVPAVRALMLVGVDNFVERLRALGFDHLARDGDYYGYSLALGSAEVSLWQLVNAYRTLANGGRASTMTLLSRNGRHEQRILDVAASYIVSDVLADASARSVSFGLANVLAPRFFAAVKTGTSKDMRDNWCVGFTGKFTVGVWVGNFDGSPMRDVSGVSGAAPIWLDLVNYLQRRPGATRPARPAGVVSETVQFDENVEPAREELFIPGTETRRIASKRGPAARARIAYPSDGTLVAIDPDIPVPVQQMQFSMRPELRGHRFKIDGVQIEASSRWAPVAGEHLLELIDARGEVVDTLRFRVRGALRSAQVDAQ